MQQALSHLKVVELASVLAGPAVGMFFAELGAKVIKVENPRTGGDVTRSWRLPAESNENTSAYFSSVNWKKEIVFADITSSAGRNCVYEHLKDADIVITNYKKGDDVKLGLDHGTIKKLNPGIIYASITGFGNESSRTAFDIVLQAESGFMYMNGTKESGPVKMPVALIDILAAHQLKEGILVALLQKARTGKGAKVSVSLFDAAIASLANQASNWLMAKHDPQPIGTLHPNIAPYGEIFRTKDGKMLVLAIGSDKQFQGLCQLIGIEPTDERYRSNTARVKNRSDLARVIEKKLSERNSDDLMKDLHHHDVPAGIIRPISEVFQLKEAQDLILPQMEANGANSLRVRTAIFAINN